MQELGQTLTKCGVLSHLILREESDDIGIEHQYKLSRRLGTRSLQRERQKGGNGFALCWIKEVERMR